MNQTNPGMKFKNSNLNGGNHPPIKSTTAKELIKIIFAYSPRKNNAKGMDEYSTLYPATNSDSASGKSKGCLFVSAKIEIKKTTNIGKSSKSI